MSRCHYGRQWLSAWPKFQSIGRQRRLAKLQLGIRSFNSVALITKSEPVALTLQLWMLRWYH